MGRHFFCRCSNLLFDQLLLCISTFVVFQDGALLSVAVGNNRLNAFFWFKTARQEDVRTCIQTNECQYVCNGCLATCQSYVCRVRIANTIESWHKLRYTVRWWFWTVCVTSDCILGTHNFRQKTKFILSAATTTLTLIPKVCVCVCALAASQLSRIIAVVHFWTFLFSFFQKNEQQNERVCALCVLWCWATTLTWWSTFCWCCCRCCLF